MIEQTHKKYAVAILTTAVVVLTAVSTAASGHIGWVEIWQLIAITLGAVASYIVPVLGGRWRGGAKVGVAIAFAIVTALIPFLGVWTLQAIVIVILAGVQALATQLGVAIRVDGTDAVG